MNSLLTTLYTSLSRAGRGRPSHVCPLLLDSISRDLSCMQKRRGRPWRKWEHGVFCRSAARDHPPHRPQGSIAGPKRVTAKFGCRSRVGFHQRSSNGLDHAGSHRRANGSSESSSGLSTYVIVMIIMKRYQAFFSHSQSTFPYIPNINSS